MRLRRTLRSLYASQKSLYGRLFWYMLGIAALVFGDFVLLLLLFGRLSSPGELLENQLTLQMEFFEDAQLRYWDQLAARGIDLSEDLTGILETFLDGRSIALTDLSLAGADTEQLETLLLADLADSVSRTECSGGFVVLNAPSSGEEAARPGVYVKKTAAGQYSSGEQDLVLYRGISQAAAAENLFLHGKWRLDFDIREIPDFAQMMERAQQPLEEQYDILSSVRLNGTDDEVWYLMVPLVGSAGEAYGLCGFEISRSSFRAGQEQPTGLKHLLCLLSASPKKDTLDADAMLDCGYSYYPPSGQLHMRKGPGGLTEIAETAGAVSAAQEKETSAVTQKERKHAGNTRFIGIRRQITLSPLEPDFELMVLIPKSDYDAAVFRGNLQLILLGFLMLFFVLFCGTILSRKYVSPILSAIYNIRQNTYEGDSVNIRELDEMSDFLKARRREHEEEVSDLNEKRREAEREAQRLAYSRKREIDPLIYEDFTEGLKTLTPSEKRILDLYLDGLGTKEVLEKLGIKESTLRYHNKNIYSKLGVNSRKQAVLYASVVRKNKERKD